MISPYYDFILEQLLLEAKMSFSNDFRDILINMKSPLADEILKLNNKEVDINTNYIEVTGKEDVISFKPENSKNDKRSEIKVGRFAKRLLDKAGIQTTDRDIEIFVNDFKSELKIVKGGGFENIVVVTGDDIKFGYDGDNYDSGEGGSLLGSCMRYKKCQNYLELYTRNPNQVSLIILKNKDRVKGRALLWTDTQGRKFMDRAYTIADSDELLFVKFAEKNGYLYKEQQDNSEYTNIIGTAGVALEDGKITVLLENHGDFSYYPYLDTLKYYSPYEGLISNDENIDYTCKLEDTDGGNGSCDTCGGSSTIECSSCNGDGNINCDECGGDGDKNCSNCSGEGDFDCHNCDGAGEEECSTCDGSGKENEGEEDESDCTDCDGKGKTDCSTCDGSSKVECDECDGRGTENCDNCGGSGNYDCYNCEGNGTEDCHVCN